jgi:hypothetical protein
LLYVGTITDDRSCVRRLSHIYFYCPQRSLNWDGNPDIDLRRNEECNGKKIRVSVGCAHERVLHVLGLTCLVRMKFRIISG